MMSTHFYAEIESSPKVNFLPDCWFTNIDHLNSFNKRVDSLKLLHMKCLNLNRSLQLLSETHLFNQVIPVFINNKLSTLWQFKNPVFEKLLVCVTLNFLEGRNYRVPISETSYGTPGPCINGNNQIESPVNKVSPDDLILDPKVFVPFFRKYGTFIVRKYDSARIIGRLNFITISSSRLSAKMDRQYICKSTIYDFCRVT